MNISFDNISFQIIIYTALTLMITYIFFHEYFCDEYKSKKEDKE